MLSGNVPGLSTFRHRSSSTPEGALVLTCCRVKPTVLLADDHAMVREALAELVSVVAELIGQVTDGGQLVQSARQLRPDIIVTDVAMPVMSGLDALRKLKTEGSTARFIVLTVDADPRLAIEAMRVGASGYVLKRAAAEELGEAIRAVADGRTYLSPLVIKNCPPGGDCQ